MSSGRRVRGSNSDPKRKAYLVLFKMLIVLTMIKKQMELFLLGCLPRDYCYTAFIPLRCDGDFFQPKGRIPVSKRSWRKTHSSPDKMSSDNKWAFYFKHNLFPSCNHTCQFEAQRFLPCILLKQGPMHICHVLLNCQTCFLVSGKSKLE